MKYVCDACRETYDWKELMYRCRCGGLLHLLYERSAVDELPVPGASDHSLWRFRADLPPLDPHVVSQVTMGEGGTPLIRLGEKLWGKADYLMPTLSFKDRGAAVLVSAMHQVGIRSCVIDSSGNAATSVAAYCARVGIECEVFVPAHTSAKKVQQIICHGAKVHRIEGTREDTADAAIAHVKSTGAFYASHIFNPFFLEGTKTYIYELLEQQAGTLGDILVLPVGNGTLLLGALLALDELTFSKQIEKVPLVVAVQAANCAPLAGAWASGSVTPAQIETRPTLAEGIASARPARGEEILRGMARIGGRFVTVDEEQILRSRDFLAARGVYVELTSAANHAGYLALLEEDPGLARLSAVIPLCGAGLKSSH